MGSPPYVKSKNAVCQCRSNKTIITAAPNTGVTIASIRKVSKIEIVIKGISTRLLRKPGATNVRLVINKLVKEIVVLIPASTTLNNKISCAPTPVYLVCEDIGVIKVQPDVVNVLFEHFVK
jgi:hypothetical protein